MPARSSAAVFACVGCSRRLRPLWNFCPNCGAARAGGASLQVAATANLEEERRLVTVLFADLTGSTTIGEQLDPEDMRRLLTEFFSALAEQVERFGGSIDKYIGDAVMAVFGVPDTHEDDAERALNAAVEMLAAVSRLSDRLERETGGRLAIRIGVNSGEVVSGGLTGNRLGAYTVVGDTVNTAQRLQSAARPGEVVVGLRTENLAGHRFTFERLPALKLKGKREAVPAFRLIGRSERVAATGRTPLVGRKRELAQLREALAGSLNGAGWAVSLVGEAGIGKSRLLAEFITGLDPEVEVIHAQCASFEEQTPYSLVAHLLRSALGLQRSDPEEASLAALRAAAGRLEIDLDPDQESLILDTLGYRAVEYDADARHRILASLIVRFLTLRSYRAPQVVVAEDLHWVDSPSASVLEAVAAGLGSVRALMVATGRTEWAPRWRSFRLELEPLGSSEERSLIERCLGRVDTAVADAILTKAGGNPFFLVEVARSLQESGAIALEAGVWTAQSGVELLVPDTVQEVLGARIDRLRAGPRRAATTAAVIGRTFAGRVLAAISPDPRLHSHLDLLARERFIESVATDPEPAYAFLHALIQEVAYGKLLRAQRRSLHGAVGDALAVVYAERQEEFVDLMAFHYSRSADDAKARLYLILAAQRALRLSAVQEALAGFQAASLRSQDDPGSQLLAVEGIADCERILGRYPEALAGYQAALQMASETGSRARLLRKLGAILQLQGHFAEALQCLDQALASLPPESAREEAFVLAEIGVVRWHEGEFEEAVEMLNRAVERAAAAGADDARADALKQLGTVLVVKGASAAGLDRYRESLALYAALGDRLGQANVHNNIAIVQRRQGEFRAALESHGRALELRERIGDPLGIGHVHNNRAQIHRAVGDLEQARTDYDRALGLWEAIGFASGVATARTGLGIATVEAGDHASGREQLTRALEEWRELGIRSYLSETQRYLAQAHLPEQPDEAERLAKLALATAQELKLRDQEGIALQVLGVAQAAQARVDEAGISLEASRMLLEEAGDRQEYARTLAALGTVYLTIEGDDPRLRGTELIEAARVIFTEIGAQADLERLEQLAPAG